MILTVRLLTLVGLLALPGAAWAQALVICNVGGPGTTSQAQPVLDKFLRHVEKAGGLASGTMTGEYHSTLAGCKAYVQKASPALGVFDLNTYLMFAKTWKLRPLAHMGAADSQAYHVLVRKGTVKDLAALKGKTLVTTIEDARYLSKIALSGKAAATDFKVKTTGRPLKGIRKVARSKADATVVDAMAFKHLKELKLPTELVSIHNSAGLPGLTLAALDINSSKAKGVVAKVDKALPTLCSGDGKKMCTTFQVSAFVKAKPAAYTKLVAQYNK